MYFLFRQGAFSAFRYIGPGFAPIRIWSLQRAFCVCGAFSFFDKNIALKNFLNF